MHIKLFADRITGSMETELEGLVAEFVRSEANSFYNMVRPSLYS